MIKSRDKEINNLSCIEINIDHLIKELLWIENAVANGYRTTIVLLKDYCSLVTFVIQNLMARWKL